MSSVDSLFDAENLPRDPQSDAVVIYEDVLAGEMGRDVALQFVEDIRGSAPTVAVWNAALLDDHSFRSYIEAQVAEAELIVIAVRSAGGFTQSLKRWTHRWTLDESNSRAVVIAIEDPSEKETADLATFAEGAARRASLDLFRLTKRAQLPGNRFGRPELLWLI